MVDSPKAVLGTHRAVPKLPLALETTLPVEASPGIVAVAGAPIQNDFVGTSPKLLHVAAPLNLLPVVGEGVARPSRVAT